MNLVYTTSTDDFQPISFGDSYLYDNYGRLNSFLKSRLTSTELQRLAKPMLTSKKQIEWHSSFDGPMQSLDAYPQEIQVKVEKEYLELFKKIERTVSEFRTSQDKDKEEWASILGLVFNPSDNKLLYNGSEWMFIWGWQFRNKLIIQSPEFNIPEEIEEIPQPEESASVDPELPPVPPVFTVPPVPEPKVEEPKAITPEEEKPVDGPKIPVRPVVPRMRQRLSFWERIKRFFRWIAYRFWGLMMLIVFVLIILCLCKRCCHEKQDCSAFEKVDKELKILEDRVKERCPEVEVEQEPAR
jgi:hypothetical protein